jgi:hypothetical protein
MVHDEETTSLPDGFQNRLRVEGTQRNGINYLSFDTNSTQFSGRPKTFEDHVRNSDNRYIRPLFQNSGATEWNCIWLSRHVPFAVMQHPMLDEHDRIVCTNRCREKSFGVVGRTRSDHFETGDVHKE